MTFKIAQKSSSLTSSALFVGSVLALALISISVPHFYGHDWQRLVQIIIGTLALIWLINTELNGGTIAWIPLYARGVSYFIFAAGIASVLGAQKREWAIVEFALLIVCCCIAVAMANARRRGGAELDKVLVACVLIICGVKASLFLLLLAASLLSGVSVIDTSNLLEGFSNRRFYGQFQTFTLPLLALPLLVPSAKRWVKLSGFILLACWWMIAICGATRGTWLGMTCAAVVIFFGCGPLGKQWLGWQATAAAIGLLLFWLCLSVLPALLGIEVVNFAGDRINASLSSRDVIWRQAYDMIQLRPLLGFGPMQFATIHNSVAAHPHQAILQWASEWGVLSTLLIGWLATHGLLATLGQTRGRIKSSQTVDLLRICLFASLIGALTQSMVDGVLVMPCSQLWLAIIVGWLMGIHNWSVRPTVSSRVVRIGWIIAMSLSAGALICVTVRDFSHLGVREEQYIRDFGGTFQPRFWEQGVIADRPQSIP